MNFHIFSGIFISFVHQLEKRNSKTGSFLFGKMHINIKHENKLFNSTLAAWNQFFVISAVKSEKVLLKWSKLVHYKLFQICIASI